LKSGPNQRAGEESGMAAENSFDIACKIDMQEVANAVNQARREIETRYDLKGTKSEVTLDKMDIFIRSPDDMKLRAVLDILQSKLHRRGIDLKAVTVHDAESAAGGSLRQRVSLQDGIPVEKAREIVRLIKDSKIKVQASIQEKQVRVVGKNRDDLQAVIQMLKGRDLGIALQFVNYRST
jgi:uncharacterized protein YajQ (UPF0234 family)